MIGRTISHYKILEKLGEVPIRLDLASGAPLSPVVGLSLPASRESQRQAGIPAVFWREPQEVYMIGQTISHYHILEKLPTTLHNAELRRAGHNWRTL